MDKEAQSSPSDHCSFAAIARGAAGRGAGSAAGVAAQADSSNYYLRALIAGRQKAQQTG